MPAHPHPPGRLALRLLTVLSTDLPRTDLTCPELLWSPQSPFQCALWSPPPQSPRDAADHLGGGVPQSVGAAPLEGCAELMVIGRRAWAALLLSSLRSLGGAGIDPSVLDVPMALPPLPTPARLGSSDASRGRSGRQRTLSCAFCSGSRGSESVQPLCSLHTFSKLLPPPPRVQWPPWQVPCF